MQALLAVVVLLDLYGALYPLGGVRLPDLDTLDLVLTAPWVGVGGARGLTHLLAMVPIGLVGTHALFPDRRLSQRASAALALALGVTLSILLLRPGPNPSLGLLGYAGAGSVLGALVAAVPGIVRRTRHGLEFSLPASAAVAVLLVVAHLAPYAPVTSTAALAQQLRPLLDYPSPAPLAIAAEFLHRVDAPAALRAGLGWLLATALLAAGRRDGGGGRILALMLPVLALEAVVARNGLSPTDLAAALGALLLWYGAMRWLPDRERAVALFAVLALIASGLFPFAPRGRAVAVEWLPFVDLPRAFPVALGEIARGLLLWGGTAALMRAAGAPALGALVLLTLVALLIEVGQVFLAAGAPGASEPFLALAAAALMAALAPPRPTLPPVRRPIPAGASGTSGDGAAGLTGRFGVAAVIALAGTGLVVAALLLRPAGSGPRLAPGSLAPLVFAATVLWFGAGAALIGGRLAVARRPWAEAPLLTLLAGVLAAALLLTAMDGASLSRIIGGGAAAPLLERAGRALVLFAAVALPMAAGVAAGVRAAQHRELPFARRVALFGLALAVYGLHLLPWWALAVIGLAAAGVGPLLSGGGSVGVVLVLLWVMVAGLAAALLARVLAGREAHPVALLAVAAGLGVPGVLLLGLGGATLLAALAPAVPAIVAAAGAQVAATLVGAMGAAVPLTLHRLWLPPPRD